MPTEAEVLDALRPVEDPEIHQSIVDLDMVRGIAIDGDRVGVTVALTVAGCPLRGEITRRVTMRSPHSPVSRTSTSTSPS